MNADRSFIKLAVWAAFLSVATTLYIHLKVPVVLSFEQRLYLFQDPSYLIDKWLIMLHCLLVIISMTGFAVLRIKDGAGFVVLGWLGFFVFGAAEISRQMMVLYYLNPLRELYLNGTDETVKQILKVNMENVSLSGGVLFGVFSLFFLLGNLFYGISIWKENGLTKMLSWLFLLWALKSVFAIGNDFWNSSGLDTALHYFNLIIQPIIRLVTAIWLMGQLKKQF